jgi:hypothetical protein
LTITNQSIFSGCESTVGSVGSGVAIYASLSEITGTLGISIEGATKSSFSKCKAT